MNLRCLALFVLGLSPKFRCTVKEIVENLRFFTEFDVFSDVGCWVSPDINFPAEWASLKK